MIVITINGERVTGWRAWLIVAAAAVVVAIVLAIVLTLVLGIALAVGTILLIGVPIAMVVGFFAYLALPRRDWRP
jgi:hypothetical protein